ncbi:hypothetical protein DN069_04780 [Streptacidiphilus pinicola]|uniref:Uncharacterized protein n=1 Tax=Streptacidiphilus pinicola TaxID=2219663 RepID=A0A2X0J974_9ACTN|nr:hypothetical protein [Streptacidiphilus pinicola]RAG86846.1 hypothetical protein DN069_04780 [Streptacidiphilus pinicola]
MTDHSRVERVIRNVVVAVVALILVFYGLMAWGLHSRASTPVGGRPGTSATPSGAAAAITADLNGDLNSGFLSPGQTYGGPFTQGTVVDQVESHGGVVLSMRGLTQSSLTVMLGVGSAPTCSTYSFTLTHDSTQQQPSPCPGGTATQLARTLLAQPTTGRQQSAAPAAYPPTVAGVRTLLLAELGSQAATVPFATAATTAPTGTPVLVAAVRVHGICDFVRLGTSTTISSWVPLWPAPVDDQTSCTPAQALAAGNLYGSDPALEG